MSDTVQPHPRSPSPEALQTQLNQLAESVRRLHNCCDYIINVKDFGAKGDGKANDSAAIRAAIRELNGRHGNALLLFPPATYYVDEYKINGGPHKNGLTDIDVKHCSNFRISGYGAKVSMKGNFSRSSDFVVTTAPQATLHGSWSESITFRLIDCAKFVVEGLEFYGNVDRMTNGGVIEGDCDGISTEGCTQYTLRDLDIHHFASDGLLIGVSSTVADKQVVVDNVRCWANGRNSLSVIQVRGALFQGCRFDAAGRTDSAGQHPGPYGGHSPQAGCDVEPDYGKAAGIDEETGNITFKSCSFTGSMGSQFSACSSAIGGMVALECCEFDPLDSTTPYTVILANRHALMDGCTLRNGTYFASIAGAPTGAHVEVRNSRFFSQTTAVIAAADAAGPFHLRFENNTVIGTMTSSSGSYVVYIQNPLAVVRGNYFWIPAAHFTGASNYQVALLIQRTLLAESNFFDTDLVDNGQNNHFATSYDGSRVVANETYPVSRAFRPGYNSALDNKAPYGYGFCSFGAPVVVSDSLANKGVELFYEDNYDYAPAQTQPTLKLAVRGGGWHRIGWGPSAPSVPPSHWDPWQVGDVVYNTLVSAGGSPGWVFTASGWKALANVAP